MIVTLEKLSPGELHNLTRLAPETDEGRRFKERVLIAWFERTHPWAMSVTAVRAVTVAAAQAAANIAAAAGHHCPDCDRVCGAPASSALSSGGTREPH
jgi:hypothetical protein